MVVIVTHVLQEMILAPEPIFTAMASAKSTRIFRKVGAKRPEMSVENIEAREEATALAAIRTVLHFLSMPEELRLRAKCLITLNTMKRPIILNSRMAYDVRSYSMGFLFFVADEGFIACIPLTSKREMTSVLRMFIKVVVIKISALSVSTIVACKFISIVVAEIVTSEGNLPDLFGGTHELASNVGSRKIVAPSLVDVSLPCS